MEDHIYEDPDSMLSTPCDITLVPRDYRESPVTHPASTGTKSGVSPQKLGTAKASKKWNIKLMGKKGKKASGESGSKQGSTDQGKKDIKKAGSDASLKKGQVKKSKLNMNRAGVSESMLQRGKDSTDTAEHRQSDGDSSPPPILPTRGYLMDEEFSMELNALEKQLAHVSVESDDDDEYTPMGCVQDPAEEDEPPNTPPVPKTMSHDPFIPPRRQVVADTPESPPPPIPKRHYTLSDSAKKPLTSHATKQRFTEGAPSIPARSYENMIPQECVRPVPTVAKKPLTRSDNSAEKSDNPLIPERQYVEEGVSSIPPRSHKNLTTAKPQERVPTETPHTRSNTSAEKPHHPLIPKTHCVENTPQIPDTSYMNLTDESHEACCISESTENLYVNEGCEGRKSREHPCVGEDDEGLYINQDRESSCINEEDGGLYINQDREGPYVSEDEGGLYINQDHEGSCINEEDGGLYINQSREDSCIKEEEDGYINEDEGQYVIERDKNLYANHDNIPTGTDRRTTASGGHNSDSEGEYEYVLSDAARCMRRLMGRKTGRRTK